jgi:hypothetical protein
MRRSQDEVAFITRHAGTNIELVAQLSGDLDQERFLIEQHVSEKENRHAEACRHGKTGVIHDARSFSNYADRSSSFISMARWIRTQHASLKGTAHKSLTVKNCINRGQQVRQGMLFMNVTLCPQEQSFLYNFYAGLLGYEDYFCVWDV